MMRGEVVLKTISEIFKIKVLEGSDVAVRLKRLKK